MGAYRDTTTVEIPEENGEYTAVDSETGAIGVGNTRALAALAVRLGAQEDSDTDSRAELRSLADRTRERSEEEGVTEDDVRDAIARARSESSSIRTFSCPYSDSEVRRSMYFSGRSTTFDRSRPRRRWPNSNGS